MAKDKFQRMNQKRLDFDLKQVYTNRIDNVQVALVKTAFKKKYLSMHPVNNKLHSTDMETTETVDKTIRRIATAIKEVIDVEYPNRPYPLIAGGAVRDCVFGLSPRDYDVFVDVSELEEDERDDYVLLLSHGIMDKLGWNKDTDTTIANVEYEEERYATLPNGKPFIVYNAVDGRPVPRARNDRWFEDFLNGGGHLQINERGNFEPVGGPPLAADDGPAEPIAERPKFLPVQFIGREITGLTLLEDFDYAAVKCLFDPTTMEYVFADSFTELMTTKTMDLTDKAFLRAKKWLNRFKTPMPIKLIDTVVLEAQKKFKKNLSGAQWTRGMSTGTTIQYVRNMAGDNAIFDPMVWRNGN